MTERLPLENEQPIKHFIKIIFTGKQEGMSRSISKKETEEIPITASRHEKLY
jgi:hypothetical protein